jgi:prepilin-type N-terminal cleavage/methylation domain-containing protein
VLTVRYRETHVERRRDAFTLAELVVVVTLLGTLMAAVTGVVLRQQHFYGAATEVIATHDNLRQGLDVLESELRGLTPFDGDIYAMTPSSVEFRATGGTSVVCTIDASRTLLTIPPSAVPSRQPLTTWIAAPVRGDSLLILDLGTDPGPDDDRWAKRALAADPTPVGSCPTASGFTATAAEAAAAWTLRLDSPLDSAVTPGAALRFFRRARYELYRASDGLWYLGYVDCLAGRSPQCSVVQPVSGPYTPGGVHFDFLDTLGSATADPRSVARIDVLTWAESPRVVHDSRGRVARFRDSLTTSIALRN